MGQMEDDRVFARVSALGAALLNFRKVVLPARGVLSDLATRRSLFLSETTQHLLGNLVSSAERVLQDLLVDRDILSESLNLYMSLVSHRTNQVMKRLTVVSVIFLPLTFLCGVYGMNFEHLPELKWQYGYPLFWFAVALIVGGIVWFSRRARLFRREAGLSSRDHVTPSHASCLVSELGPPLVRVSAHRSASDHLSRTAGCSRSLQAWMPRKQNDARSFHECSLRLQLSCGIADAAALPARRYRRR